MSFDFVAGEYEAGRPDYPDEVYDALRPLARRVVLEGGAGTGIATRALLDRGARVIPFDIGTAMLARAVERTPGLPAVIADGATLPFRDECADLICFAQAWHWLDEDRRCGEADRVLRAGGRWAGWWSHARADGEAWFERAWDVIEAACPGVDRAVRDLDWGEGVRRSGRFDVDERVTVPWLRRMRVETWLADERSKSYTASLPAAELHALLATIEQLVRERFLDGDMAVPYETWVWTATKRA